MPNRKRKAAHRDEPEDQTQAKRQGVSTEDLARDRDPALSIGASVNEGLGSEVLTTPASREQAKGGESSHDETYRDIDRMFFGATAVPIGSQSALGDERASSNGQERVAAYARRKILAAPYVSILGAFGLGLALGRVWNRERP